MDKDLITHLRACANGMASFKTDKGDYGICDDAADAITEARAKIEQMTGEKDDAIKMARAEALQDAANIVERFATWGPEWGNCTAHVSKEIRALIG